MKNFVFIIFLIITSCLFMKFISVPEKSFEVLEIVEGDKFYIDLNENKKIDNDELFHLKGANSFPLRYNKKTGFYAKKFGLTIAEVFKLGYSGKEFTKKMLLHKRITFLSTPENYNASYSYRFASIALEDKDYALILLENGLGFAYWKESGAPYMLVENKEKIKENAKILNSLDLKVLDSKKNIYHDLDCPEAVYIENPIFRLKKLINTKKFKKCPFCTSKSDFQEASNKEAGKIENASTGKKNENLELFLINPNNCTKPSKRCRTNICQALLFNIKNAKESIDLALYGLDNQNEIIEALKGAKARGIKIRGVADTNSKGEFAYRDTKLLESVGEIKYDETDHLMHNKFFIFDDKKVLTGSANISPTGTGGYNSNSAIIINNKEVAQIYKNEFEQMFEGYFQNKKPHNYSKNNIKINKDTSVDIYFSPKGKIYENALHPIIQNAKNKIYIDIFYLTHKDFVVDLIEARKRGVEIKIIIDATSAVNQKSKLKELRTNNIKIKVENWGGKAHEKTIMIDDKYLILGSANFSASACKYNDENLVIIKNSEFARFYDMFFMKLYNSIDNIYLTKTPAAESFYSKNSCYDGIDNDFDGKIDNKDDSCKRKALH